MPEGDRASLRRLPGSRALSFVLGAYSGSVIAEWALWTSVLVYSFQHGGSTAAGVTAIALLVPAAAVAPHAGRAADGPRPELVVLVVYVVEAASLIAAAALAAAGATAAAVIGCVAVAIGGVTFIRPAVAVVVPGLVTTPADLVAANLRTGRADGAGVLIGPLLASALVSISGPALAFAVCAAINVGCTAMTWSIGRRCGPRATGPVASTPTRAGRVRELINAVHTMSHGGGSLSLLVVLGTQYALIGAVDLLVVNLAIGSLGLGESGPGLLTAAFGAGAMIGGLATSAVVGRHRLAIVMIASLITIAAAMSALGAWPTVVGTLIVLPVTGASRSLLDVSGRMMLQRCAPQDALASIFAVLEVLAGAGILCGSLLVQLLVAGPGVRAAVIGVAVLFAAVSVLTAPGLRHADQHADAPVVEIRLLRNIALFAPLPGPPLEVLARSCTSLELAAGEVVVREGEPGDRYYAIADGVVEVTVDHAAVRTMSRGEGFGEIALLADLPRTATVTALTDTRLLAVERASFLLAVTGHDASAQVAWAVARSWHPPLAELRRSATKW